MLVALLNIVLNPFCIIFFLFFWSKNESLYFETTNTNVQKLKPVPYLKYLVVFVGTILCITFLFKYFLFKDLDFWSIYLPKYYWLSIIGWVVSALTLYVYFKGMEGNIMGFIFFPPLALLILSLTIVNLPDLYSFFYRIELPVINISLLPRYMVHLFLPFLLLFVTQKSEIEEKEYKLLPLFTSLLLQLFLYGLHRVVFKIWNIDLTFSAYFGEGQNILYYLPMLGGALYIICYLLSRLSRFQHQQIFIQIKQLILLLALLLSFLQILNYVKWVSTYF